MIVKQLDLNCRENVERWDAVARSQGMLYHVSSWARVIQQAYGFQPVYLYLEDKGDIVSLLPFIRVRKPFAKGELVSIPHVEAAGIVEPKPYRLYLEYLRKHLPVKIIRIYQFGNALDDLPANTREVFIIKELPSSLDQLIPSFGSRKTRQHTRNVMKKGYIVDIGNDPKLLMEFYLLYLDKMRELGTPPHGSRFMKAIVEVFGDMCRIIVVRDGQKPIGGSLFLFNGSIMNFLYISVPKKYLKLNICDLIEYHVMAFCIEKRIFTFNIGRCEMDSGVYLYKMRLGGKALPLYLYKFVRTPEGYVAVETKTAKEKYRIFSHVWCCLPATITDHFGPYVRKWIY